VLNTPIDEREYKDDITPFLNGGLFEARQNDLYKNNKLTFPKNYFDDLFKFLSEYNFTTDESTSQFQQVAIDPEMLGRIFENLLAEITEETGEQARKAKGAFYTPREIVDYMCKESLKEYLKTKLPEDTYRDQRLYQLIEAPDKDFQDQDHNWRRDWKPYKDSILTALDDLKVLDPACGSGAFPIGMLQLLVRVYERLEPRFDGYKAKLQIIEKNIYGVDIEPMAVEIARLRTWLSIVVDEESDSKKIKPLPNLEFKFVCANSLIDLDKSGATSFWDDSELENKLQVLRDSYFNTESLSKKKKLRSDYDALVNAGPNMFSESEKTVQLKTYRPFDNETSASFFNPEFMFGVKNFDMVIGNPPWVSNDTLSESVKNQISKHYSYSVESRFDLSCPFIELARDHISNSNTVVAFVLPEHLWIGEYFISLRKAIYKNLKEVSSLKEGYFENVNNPASLMILTIKEQNKITIGKSKKDLTIERKEILNDFFITETLLDSREKVIYPYKIYFNSDYLLLKEHISKQLNLKLLGEICVVTDGVQTANVLKEIMTNDQPQDTSKYFKALRKGSSIPEKYGTIIWDNWWILKPEYADDFKKPGYSYNTPKRKYCFSKKEKIVLRQTEPSIVATIDFDQYYFPNSIFQIALREDSFNLSLYYILGLINSRFIRNYYSMSAQVEGTTKPQIYINILKSMPIKLGKDAQIKKIEFLVKEIINLKKVNRKDFENKNILDLERILDEEIYNIYNLDGNLIKIIEQVI
jgi:methylase of polypeptide subunit release factors